MCGWVGEGVGEWVYVCVCACVLAQRPPLVQSFGKCLVSMHSNIPCFALLNLLQADGGTEANEISKGLRPAHNTSDPPEVPLALLPEMSREL